MYAIGTIIYGSPIGEKADAWLRKNGPDDWEDLGIETMYSGSSNHEPAYVGVDLGGIDEVTDAVGIDVGAGTMSYGPTIDNAKPFSIVPTAEQMRETQKKIDALPDGLKAVLPKAGVYLVWSTS